MMSHNGQTVVTLCTKYMRMPHTGSGQEAVVQIISLSVHACTCWVASFYFGELIAHAQSVPSVP